MSCHCYTDHYSPFCPSYESASTHFHKMRWCLRVSPPIVEKLSAQSQLFPCYCCCCSQFCRQWLQSTTKPKRTRCLNVARFERLSQLSPWPGDPYMALVSSYAVHSLPLNRKLRSPKVEVVFSRRELYLLKLQLLHWKSCNGNGRRYRFLSVRLLQLLLPPVLCHCRHVCLWGRTE